jgi:hypothetical protein
MDSQPSASKPPKNPPEAPLTEAERAELIRERNKAQTLFQKLIKQGREKDQPKGGGRSR